MLMSPYTLTFTRQREREKLHLPSPITCFSMHTVDDSYLPSPPPLPFPSLLFVYGRVLVIPLLRIPPTHFLSLTVLIRL